MAQTIEIATWWGRHRLPPERADLWIIGPLEILAEHHENFWQIHWRHVDRSSIGEGKTANSRISGLTPEQVNEFCFGVQPRSAISPYFPAKLQSVTIPVSNPNEDLIFSPVLPEESLILSIRSAAVLDPSETLTTGFLIPLVIRVETVSGQNSPREASEIPLLPLVRTWGGTKPMDGELALTPDVPLRVERWADAKPRLDVAGLAVTVANRGTDSVFVDRLVIPCSRLALFHSPQSGFWCESLVLHADSDFSGALLAATTSRELPREAGQTTLVMLARQNPAESAALKGLANFRSTIGTSVENLFKERG